AWKSTAIRRKACAGTWKGEPEALVAEIQPIGPRPAGAARVAAAVATALPVQVAIRTVIEFRDTGAADAGSVGARGRRPVAAASRVVGGADVRDARGMGGAVGSGTRGSQGRGRLAFTLAAVE